MYELDYHGFCNPNINLKIGQLVKIKGYKKLRKVAGFTDRIIQTYLKDPELYTQHKISDIEESL